MEETFSDPFSAFRSSFFPASPPPPPLYSTNFVSRCHFFAQQGSSQQKTTPFLPPFRLFLLLLHPSNTSQYNSIPYTPTKRNSPGFAIGEKTTPSIIFCYVPSKEKGWENSPPFPLEATTMASALTAFLSPLASSLPRAAVPIGQCAMAGDGDVTVVAKPSSPPPFGVPTGVVELSLPWQL